VRNGKGGIRQLKKRVTIDLSEKTYADLKKLMENMDTTSITETIRRSLGLASLIAREKKAGSHILIKTEKETKELITI
jgi:hypothetical protein